MERTTSAKKASSFNRNRSISRGFIPQRIYQRIIECQDKLNVVVLITSHSCPKWILHRRGTEGPENELFYLAGRYPPNKKRSVVSKHGFYPVPNPLRNSWFYPARDGVYDPIVPPRAELDHNKFPSKP
jgi:hypothetical protein